MNTKVSNIYLTLKKYVFPVFSRYKAASKSDGKPGKTLQIGCGKPLAILVPQEVNFNTRPPLKAYVPPSEDRVIASNLPEGHSGTKTVCFLHTGVYRKTK